MAKLLIVEDDELNREMLMRRLDRRGHQIVFAKDGEEGLEVAQAERPELILMDLTLPAMNGYEATRRLKAEVATRDIPVIALSAHPIESERDQALRAGCAEYETKPVDFERLLEKINSVLSQRMESTPLTND